MKLVWAPIFFLFSAGVGTVTYLKRDLLIDKIPRLRAAREAESIASKSGSLIDNKVAALSSQAYLLMSIGRLDAETHNEYVRYLYHCQSESIMPLSIREWLDCGAPVWQ